MGAHETAVMREHRAGRGASVALAAVVLLVFASSLITVTNGRFNLNVYRVDLNVYRLGARAWLNNNALYGQLPPTQNGLNLGFTYPPMSAVVMSPLAVVSSRVAGIIITAISLALLVAVTALFLRTAGLTERRRSWRLATALLPVAALVEPVRTTLAYGQVNVVLMALVAFDCLLPATVWRRRVPWGGAREVPVGWPRGAMVGLAAALKLTPAVFIIFFIARRQWRAAATTALSFVVVTGIGCAVALHDSVSYWTKMVFDTGRIGPLAFAGNQSVNGVLLRAHLTGSARQDVWLATSAAVGILALVAVTRAARAGLTLLALALTACAALLVSPVSWSHHWVWAAPVLLTAVVSGYRSGDRRMLAWSCAGLALFFSSPQWWFPNTHNRESGWGLWEQIIGSSYVAIALMALIYVASPLFGRGSQKAGTRVPVITASAREGAAALESPPSPGKSARA
jgi:alpha-1,2-mannosyltransferase